MNKLKIRLTVKKKTQYKIFFNMILNHPRAQNVMLTIQFDA